MRPLLILAVLSALSTTSARTLIDTRLNYPSLDLPQTETARVVQDLMHARQNPVCKDAQVLDRAKGHFTRKGANETVYIVQDCINKTGPADGLNGKYWRLALYRDGQLAQVITPAGHMIGNVGDLNGDGVDDLVFIAFVRNPDSAVTGNQGATFFTLAGGTFRRILDLNEVQMLDCGSAGLGDIRAYRVILKQPAPRPVFTIEQFQNLNQNCDASTPQDYKLLKTWAVKGR